ncbi:MAG: hypothetical protein CL539_12390 [Alcanivorax sp.]|uniref:Ig-like domain-containing protein n=1 Tax=unclassified Alcanivorax TaxID=2638842 RepID=UPI000C912470|nr:MULTISPECIES: Ig-like domain-containing protein [unclassified Alcanivorax]MAC15444.1 hypothetical protein [Alcanivorax sp.]
MMRTSVLFAAALVLTACGGGGSEQTVDYSGRNSGQVFYSYPADQQEQISVHAPLVVQFSEAPGLALSDITLTGPDGAVDVDMSEADQGRSVVITPRLPLAFNSDYTLSLNGIDLDGFSDGTLNFTTGSADKGPQDQQQNADELVISRQMPSGDGDQPFMDFSTVHLQFSQPLDRATVDDTTVSLNDNTGNPVDATLLVSGTRLTLDPKDDLSPGVAYTLALDAGLTSETGVAYSGESSITLTPQDSTPRETLVLEAMAADPTKACGEDGVMLSPLSGEPINCVPLIAKLLGDTTVSKLSGNVFAELAFVPDFPGATPLRISKGSLLKGEPLEVLIGGQLPAGFDSGDVTVSFLSDASGTLSPAPYSASPEAPRRVQLTLDLAFSTADSRANGAFTQTLLQVELVGRAIVVDGRMVIDAIGVIEPEVLGVETAYGVLSFHMESYADQTTAPEPEVDITGPSLQSWQPGDFADRFRPGDPVVLNFDETPNQDTIVPGSTVSIARQGTDVPFQWHLDGASLVLTPNDPLDFGTDYQVVFTDGVQDLSGNPANPGTLDFAMPDATTSSPRTPYTTTVYPGFPCGIYSGTEDLANGIQGECASAYQNDAGDSLPVPTLPANRPIEVQFSRNMAADSMVLGTTCGQGSVRVEKIDTAGNCLETVPAHLSMETRKLTITPQQPWENGVLYRYVLTSHEQAGCAGEVICSQDDMPLQTAQLLGPDADKGGPDMAIAFTGAAATDNVLLPLRNLPKADVNANFALEDTEIKAQETPPGSGEYPTPTNAAKLAVTDTGGIATAANIGCDINETCPADKFTYLNGGINADIVGWSEVEQAVEVTLYPPVLITTNTDVYAQIAGLVSPNVPTEPLVMRGRYDADGNGNRTQPLTGWIRYDAAEDQLMFDTTLDLLLDAPEMEAPLGLPFNLHSYPLDDLQLSGPVDFLPDGRLVIGLLSLAEQNIDVRIGGALATIDLQIPAGGVNLTFQSGSIKKPQ